VVSWFSTWWQDHSSREKIVCSTNSAGKLNSHVPKNEVTSLPETTKSNSERVKDLKVRTEGRVLLAISSRSNLHVLDFSKGFTAITSKVYVAKEQD
jgi:hypothetical protein